MRLALPDIATLIRARLASNLIAQEVPHIKRLA